MEQGFLFPPYQQHSRTSREAAERLGRHAANLRALVYAHLLTLGATGATDEEGMKALGLKGDTYRPRRIELVDSGRVYDTGRERISEKGHMMAVWAAVPV